MGTARERGIGTKMGGQPEPHRLEKPLLLKVSGMVIAAVGAIAGINALVDGVKRSMEDFQREMRRPWPPPG